MTCIVRAIPVEPPALVRISGELCLLPSVAYKTTSETPQSVLSTRLKPPALHRDRGSSPRAPLSVTGQNPFNPQYS